MGEIMKQTILVGILLLLIIIPFSLSAQSIIADHTSVAQFDNIPPEIISNISANFNFIYGHTSHGSQIITGLDMLEIEDQSLVKPAFYEFSDDLGELGDISWEGHLRWRLFGGPLWGLFRGLCR